MPPLLLTAEREKKCFVKIQALVMPLLRKIVLVLLVLSASPTMAMRAFWPLNCR